MVLSPIFLSLEEGGRVTRGGGAPRVLRTAPTYIGTTLRRVYVGAGREARLAGQPWGDEHQLRAMQFYTVRTAMACPLAVTEEAFVVYVKKEKRRNRQIDDFVENPYFCKAAGDASDITGNTGITFD